MVLPESLVTGSLGRLRGNQDDCDAAEGDAEGLLRVTTKVGNK
ncbi:hypothetical protein [Halorubrum aidingense]|nr:hypothetical protein [Halorubrum aidingense]